jgi:hypothetical protein
MAGKRGKCPKCGRGITVPAAEPDEAAIDWDVLADVESHSAPAARADTPGVLADLPDRVATPPSKASGVAAQMRSLTPQQRQALSRKASSAASAVRGPAVTDGDDQLWGFPSFLMGLTLCFAGAVIGGAIWFGLLAATGREFKIVATLIGLLAGGGMYAGYQKHDISAAFLAAAFAACGIVVAKIMILTVGAQFLAQHEIEAETVTADELAQQFYDETALDQLPPELVREGVLEHELARMRLREGLDSYTWYNMLPWMREKWIKPVRTEVDARTPEALRLDYCRSILHPEIEMQVVAAAREAFREERGLPGDEAYMVDDTLENADDWAAYEAAVLEMDRKRQADWTDFEPLRTSVVQASFEQVDTMTEAELLDGYETHREEELAAWKRINEEYRELRLAGIENMETADSEELSRRMVFFIFSPVEIIFLLLALSTAFGINSGLRNS